MDSILTSIKKLLGITENYEYFDADLIIHINSVFMILNQLGVGPDDCFRILDKTSKWEDFSSDINKIESVKTYIYLKVKLMFDPPQNGFLVESINRQLSELEWRLNMSCDKSSSTNPEYVSVDEVCKSVDEALENMQNTMAESMNAALENMQSAMSESIDTSLGNMEQEIPTVVSESVTRALDDVPDAESGEY